VGPYATLLDPPRSRKDIEYWLTREALERGISYNCINTAVEESTVGAREYQKLLAQDVFLQQHIHEEVC